MSSCNSGVRSWRGSLDESLEMALVMGTWIPCSTKDLRTTSAKELLMRAHHADTSRSMAGRCCTKRASISGTDRFVFSNSLMIGHLNTSGNSGIGVRRDTSEAAEVRVRDALSVLAGWTKLALTVFQSASSRIHRGSFRRSLKFPSRIWVNLEWTLGHSN